MKWIVIFSIIISSESSIPQTGAGAVGSLNQIKEDPALNDVQSDSHKLRKEILDLDKPSPKKLPPSPNDPQRSHKTSKKR